MDQLKKHIILIYKKKWTNDKDSDDYFLNWLETDILNWLNENQPFIYGPRKNIINFFNRISVFNLDDLLNNKININTSIVNILKVITFEELQNFYLYLKIKQN